ncbi:MAG: hypothetical protein EOP85_00905 [Verrucomicrobiaceae bacterium]|nr:MAG: hypothetical protein EOP85_00905 [Verrucomicrobiaceae bacterium]
MSTESEEPKSVTIAGLPLTCPHCKNDRFHQLPWQLSPAGLPFMNLDWLTQATKCYLCSSCGRIEWFTKSMAKEGAFSTTEGDTECLECGCSIPSGKASCRKCGWSYAS